MAFTCPNCAGKLYYSIKDKKLKCVNCGSFTEVEEYRLKNDAQEVTDTYGLSSFVCRNCGAEILASDDEAVSYCSYCGSEQVLEGRMTTETRPRFIIPFKKTKSQCKAAYKKATEKLAYLPGELRDPEFLDRFRGTYIPYWMYKVDFDGDSVIKATKKRRSGDSTIISHMDVGTRLSGDYDGVPYDASSCFDDTISDLIMPFKKEDLTPFTPAYMAGFYADRASVPPENYREDALVRASGAALEEMKRTFQSRKMSMEEPSPEERVEVMKPRCDNFFATLFPVWFLTWRKKGRVAYTIVNGQTGELAGDFPVDIKKYYLVTLAIAAVIFLIMTLAVSMTARFALGLCAFLVMIVGAVFGREAESIRDRENHVFDKGYFVKDRIVAMPEETREAIRSKVRKKKDTLEGIASGSRPLTYLPGGLLIFIWIFMFVGGSILWQGMGLMLPATRLKIAATVIAVITFFISVKGYSALRYVEEKSLLIFNTMPLLAALAALVIAWIDPVDDVYYYMGSTLCGACAALTSVGIIRYFNLLTTRPIPNFFDREGGRDHAED